MVQVIQHDQAGCSVAVFQIGWKQLKWSPKWVVFGDPSTLILEKPSFAK